MFFRFLGFIDTHACDVPSNTRLCIRQNLRDCVPTCPLSHSICAFVAMRYCIVARPSIGHVSLLGTRGSLTDSYRLGCLPNNRPVPRPANVCGKARYENENVFRCHKLGGGGTVMKSHSIHTQVVRKQLTLGCYVVGSINVAVSLLSMIPLMTITEVSNQSAYLRRGNRPECPRPDSPGHFRPRLLAPATLALDPVRTRRVRT